MPNEYDRKVQHLIEDACEAEEIFELDDLEAYTAQWHATHTKET